MSGLALAAATLTVAAALAAGVRQDPGERHHTTQHLGRLGVAALALPADLPAALLAASHGPSPGAEKPFPGKAFRDPAVWGPPTWFFLHCMTLALPDQVPEEQQERIRGLMYDLQKVLPCPACGAHLADHMRLHPIEPHLATRDGLVQWMVDIHNLVNVDIGKREWTRTEAEQHYAKAFSVQGPRGYLAVLGGDRSGAARGRGPATAGPVASAALALLLALLAGS
mmetsp:Transcript_2209/g.6269  ORF Transcript_2209/g.6269 Transcript_2209/m.6269 type:complete len:225 (-) Transcript_2209:29-703(-)